MSILGSTLVQGWGNHTGLFNGDHHWEKKIQKYKKY
jgi:hypothetical protein